MSKVTTENIVWHQHQVDRAARAQLNGHPSVLLWFTALSGSGKSTLAGALESELYRRGLRTYLLDGDIVRHGLCSDLGFTSQARQAHLRRVGEVARLMVDAGLIVLAAFVSPYQAERDAIRARFAEGEFIEVFVDTPLAACEARDPKGLYKKARAGEIRHFTGIDDPYEAPAAAEIHLVNDGIAIEVAVARLLDALRQRGVLV